MTTTFSPSLNTPISRVRQLVGDVAAPFRLQDETITARLLGRSELSAAAQCARDLAAFYASAVNTDFDRQRQEDAALFDHYTRLAEILEAKARQEGGAALGGASVLAVTGLDPCRENWSPRDWGDWDGRSLRRY